MAVIFAFIANKIWVFKSSIFDRVIFWKECFSFFACRLFTGGIDVISMYVMVDIFSLEASSCKLMANVVVVIVNYIMCKFIIFKQ